MAFRRDEPLQAYRIADFRFPILDGGGAAQHGARWNSPGRRVVYAASTYSGAVLEKLVHVNIGSFPANQVEATITIPAGVLIEEIDATVLPSGWEFEQTITRAMGDRWYDECQTVVLIVPSAVTRGKEKNILMNQSHPDFSMISFEGLKRVSWDSRLLALIKVPELDI
jgi:RES domain-containing protein